MAQVNPNISEITVNINKLNFSVNWKGISEWVKTSHNLTLLFIKNIPFKTIHNDFENKVMKKFIQGTWEEIQSSVAK